MLLREGSGSVACVLKISPYQSLFFFFNQSPKEITSQFLPSVCVCVCVCVCACTVAQSVQLFCDPMDCSPSGSSAHGIVQASIQEQVAISYSRGS